MGPNGTKMIALSVASGCRNLTFDSDAFDEVATESLRERIVKETAARKLAKKEAKELRESGTAEGSAAKPKKKRPKTAACESQ